MVYAWDNDSTQNAHIKHSNDNKQKAYMERHRDNKAYERFKHMPDYGKGAVMERLTRRSVNGTGVYATPSGEPVKWENNRHNVLQKLADYEDLDKQGRLVKLPCKVGDTVYGISMGKIITLTVNEISIFYLKGEKIINVKCQSNDEFRNYVEREFGKTVFLTEPEAKERLKELRGRENG